MSKKKKKNKNAQNYFKLRYVIEYFKTSKFNYQKILIQLNFLQRYEALKFLIFGSEVRVKI